MGRLLPLGLVSIAVLGGGCGGGGGRAFADLVYQVYCPPFMPGEPGCPTNNDPRDIQALDNEDDHSISCSVSDEGEDQQVLDFSALKLRASGGATYGIEARSVLVPRGGGSVMGGGCTVTVIEDDGDNRYAGRCGANPPTDLSPCQISDVDFGTDDGGSAVALRLLCHRIPNMTAPELTRDVRMAGAAGDRNASFGIRLDNCTGL
jgi:hypothetical protein